MEMLSLFMKPTIREGVLKIFTAFKDAGIDLNSKVFQLSQLLLISIRQTNAGMFRLGHD